jgi:hypothetical protein
METFKGAKSATGGGEQSFKMVCFHCGIPGLHKGVNKFCQLRGRLIWGLLHFDETPYKYHAQSCIMVITSHDP